jgi:hypothetical protein
VNRQNLLGAFEFQQQTPLHQNSEPQGFFEDQALVFDADEALIDGMDHAQIQFPQETAFIDALDGRADNLPAQVVSVLKKRRQVPFLQRGNKGNEGFCPCPSLELPTSCLHEDNLCGIGRAKHANQGVQGTISLNPRYQP